MRTMIDGIRFWFWRRPIARQLINWFAPEHLQEEANILDFTRKPKLVQNGN